MTTALSRPCMTAFCGCATPHDMTRRRLLKGGAATLALGAAAPSLITDAVAQTPPHRIDVHHHISPPTWLDAVKSMQQANPLAVSWSIQKTLDDMDKGGVATSITSATTPQVTGLDVERASRVARESNEYAKKLESDYKGRFGTWAMLPFPHVDACLKEIEYAFDTLKVDGVGCMTSYGDKWLGYAEFEPVWAELNRRKATVYTHPTGANCCVNLVKGADDSWIEYGTDTARSIFTIIFSGFGAKYPDINWIWSHGGGTLTSIYERFTVQALRSPDYSKKFTREQIDEQIKRYYYDTAAIPNDVTMSALVKMVPTSHIVFGSDFPYRRAEEYAKFLPTFFQGENLKAIDRDNALRLLPRWRTS